MAYGALVQLIFCRRIHFRKSFVSHFPPLSLLLSISPHSISRHTRSLSPASLISSLSLLLYQTPEAETPTAKAAPMSVLRKLTTSLVSSLTLSCAMAPM